MSKTFCAEMLTRSEFDRTNQRLEITVCNAAGESQTISINARIAETLSSILGDHFQSASAFGALREFLTAMPSATAATSRWSCCVSRMSRHTG
jgi:hypothetical protein